MTATSTVPRPRSLIPACDVGLEKFEDIVRQTGDMPVVGAYKLGASLCLVEGLSRVVETARSHTDKPLIYDHQKAGTDIPETGTQFMKALSAAGISAVILFPFSGPVTQHAWTKAAVDAGLRAIIGGHMTHPSFLASENGYIADEGVSRIYELAAKSGVTEFVVPGNNVDAITRIRALVERDVESPTFYAPGFVVQLGEISDAGRAAGDNWHAIVGRAIYDSGDIRGVVESLAQNL